MDERVENLETSINELLKFDTQALDKSEAFGVEGYEFLESRHAVEFSKGLIKTIDVQKLKYMQPQNLGLLHQKVETLLGRTKVIVAMKVGERGTEKVELPAIEKTILVATTELAELINKVAFAFSVYTLDGRMKPKLLAEIDEIKKSHLRFNKSIDSSTEKLNLAMFGAAQRADQKELEFDKLVANANKKLAEASKRVTAFETQTLERLKLSSLSDLWAKKVTSHRVQHWLMIFVLLFVTGTFLWLLNQAISTDWLSRAEKLLVGQTSLVGWENLVAFLAPKFIVVGLPIAGLIWFLRIFVRLFLSNKLLLDDALQRKAISDTYFSLLEGDQDVEKERHLMLNAMFRPLPGEPNDIDPPNLAELMKLGKQPPRHPRAWMLGSMMKLNWL